MATMLCQVGPGTLHTNVQIADSVNGGFHPQLCDVYIPSVPIVSSIVLLHGGSGTKENFARNLRIALATTVPMVAANVNWALVNAWRSVIIIPQGGHCDGTVGPFNPNGANTVSSANPNGVATWTNKVMWSGADDVAYLKDVSANYIPTTFGAIGKNIAGHSNGGMMVNRMWHEAPAYFAHFMACSGPQPDTYRTSPVTQSSYPPFFSQFGQLDSVVDVSDGPAGTGLHFYDTTLEQNPAQLSVADVAYPNPTFWTGPFLDFQNKVLAATGQTISQSSGVVTNIQIGTQTTWKDSTGAYVLQLLSNAEHQVGSHEQCTGRYLFGDFMNFILAN